MRQHFHESTTTTWENASRLLVIAHHMHPQRRCFLTNEGVVGWKLVVCHEWVSS